MTLEVTGSKPVGHPKKESYVMDPIQVLIVGDSHGNLRFMHGALALAKEQGIPHVIQVGDFGFWPELRRSEGGMLRPFPDPEFGFAGLVDKRAKELGIIVWVVRGNHEWRVEAGQYTGGDQTLPGLHCLSDGFRTDFNDHSVLFTGGAVSIDQRVRKVGTSWWPDEITSEEDVQASIEGGPVDVWITHDSVFIPPHKRPLWFGQEIQDQLHTQHDRMETIFRTVQPKLHIHGHWHTRYSAPTDYGTVIGVDCENSAALLVVEFGETIVVG